MQQPGTMVGIKANVFYLVCSGDRKHSTGIDFQRYTCFQSLLTDWTKRGFRKSSRTSRTIMPYDAEIKRRPLQMFSISGKPKAFSPFASKATCATLDERHRTQISAVSAVSAGGIGESFTLGPACSPGRSNIFAVWGISHLSCFLLNLRLERLEHWAQGLQSGGALSCS